MKKVLLSSLILLICCISAWAYESIIIRFPDGELWERGFYKKKGNEAILQYVLHGQSSNNWQRTIIIHSYNNSGLPINTFINNNILLLQKVNPTTPYKTLKSRSDDVIIGRCTENYGNISSQCEFFRATKAHGGIITLHYINKNKEEFMEHYDQWYNIIKTTKFYNSYYRDDRVLDKAIYFEL